MAQESHMIEAMVRGYHVYKEVWCAAIGEELSCVREVENYRDPFTMATPPANRARAGRENLRLGFYFADLIFVVCQSTAKTAKIGSLENIRLYGNNN